MKIISIWELPSTRYYVLHYWYKHYRQQQSGVDDNCPHLLSYKIVKSIAFGGIEINYPGGIRLLFHEGKAVLKH